MTLEERIQVLSQLGKLISDFDNEEVQKAITQAHRENQWFIPNNSKSAIQSISDKFLQADKLRAWISEYEIGTKEQKKVGLVLAGNIPLVGFHDVLSTFICGNHSVIKTSSKDDSLIKMILNKMAMLEPRTRSYFSITERLSGFDAVIATGSNNTAKHFEYYFRDYPKIIRKNRVSVAVVDDNTDEDALKNLGKDVFEYFGLGCRNVSKIFVPDTFNLDRLFESFFEFQDIIHHNKYKNNYDYNEAIWLMGQDDFLTNGFLHLKEEKSLYSRIGSLYYERYNQINEVIDRIEEDKENIQCISTDVHLENLKTIPLGSCQSPELDDYADNVNTIEFLLNL